MGTVFAEDPKVKRITVFTGPWIITFELSGAAHAQYGSLPGDGGYVDEGPVDYAKLLKAIKTTPRKDKNEAGDRFQVAILHERQTSTKVFTLTDESFLEQILRNLESKWKQDPHGTRFNELKEQHPIVHKKT